VDELCATAAEDVVLNWLPFDHIGSLSDWHLRCVALGCRSVYATKEAVLARPLLWLDLLDRHRATHSWAPTFAYRLLLDALARDPRAPWDLSCVKGLLCAGEQVSPDVESSLVERLGRCGLRKEALWAAFGMARPPPASPTSVHRTLPRTHHGVGIPGRGSGSGANPNRVVFAWWDDPFGSLHPHRGRQDSPPELAVGRLQVKGTQ
jgi:acyl-CoA synthetase (AMP-forming)/AMP-acid ligase II